MSESTDYAIQNISDAFDGKAALSGRAMITTIKALEEKAERDKGCEYKICIPKESGYDIDGRYYECSCGADFIDIEDSEDWICCPHCGNRINSRDTYRCMDCTHAESDGDSWYCASGDGKYDGEDIENSNFDGCKAFNPKDGEAK